MTSALVAPNIIQVLKPKDKDDKQRYKKTINKLFDDKIIYLSGERVKLSKEGKKLLAIATLDDIDKIKMDDKWDGIWHLVCYDIPEDWKRERDCFRRKLVALGFEQIQKSLWVIPYGCKEEIAVIAQTLSIAPFVAYLNTDYLPKQDYLEKMFSLK